MKIVVLSFLTIGCAISLVGRLLDPQWKNRHSVWMTFLWPLFIFQLIKALIKG